MKYLLLHVLIILGVYKLHSNSESIFKEKSSRLPASENGANGCSGCKECGGTERPSTNTR